MINPPKQDESQIRAQGNPSRLRFKTNRFRPVAVATGSHAVRHECSRRPGMSSSTRPRRRQTLPEARARRCRRTSPWRRAFGKRRRSRADAGHRFLRARWHDGRARFRHLSRTAFGPPGAMAPAASRLDNPPAKTRAPPISARAETGSRSCPPQPRSPSDRDGLPETRSLVAAPRSRKFRCLARSARRDLQPHRPARAPHRPESRRTGRRLNAKML